MSVLAQDDRFEQVRKSQEKEGVIKNMCEVLTRIENQAEIRGEIRGEMKGVIKTCLEFNMSIEDIAQKLGISVEEVEAFITTIKF